MPAAAAAAAAVSGVSPAPPPAVAITNSFGMPSMDQQYLLQDIPAAAAALGPGQVSRDRDTCSTEPRLTAHGGMTARVPHPWHAALACDVQESGVA